MALGFILILGVLASAPHAQDLKSLGAEHREYHPDDTVRLVLTFTGPVDLSSAGVQFRLVKPSDPAQSSWTSTFGITQLKKLPGDNQYEVSGAIPKFIASGQYRVISTWTSVADLDKRYEFPDTLHQDISITVVNDRKDPLPKLKEVTLLPGK